MSFDLSFSPEFFIGPYDLDGGGFNKERPTSVYQAIQAMSDDDFAEMAKSVFGCSPDFVTVETVLVEIQKTNTCGDLRSPVDVWIDSEGYHTVSVYDSQGED